MFIRIIGSFNAIDHIDPRDVSRIFTDLSGLEAITATSSNPLCDKTERIVGRPILPVPQTVTFSAMVVPLY